MSTGKTEYHQQVHGGEVMMKEPLFLAAYPYQDDVLSLPVEDIGNAAHWYSKAFGMSEIQRTDDTLPAVILERDGVKLGFSVNGGDSSQDGAAILVSDIDEAKAQLEANGLTVGDLQNDERDDQHFRVFFVVAPDGLCFYFHQLIADQNQ